MSLQYILSPNQWFSATITQYPNIQYMRDFIELLDSNNQASLLSTNFNGFIYGIIYRNEAEQQFSSKLIHAFIMRLVHCGKDNELWVKVDNRLARFSLQEFCLITGLPCHEVSINLDFSSNRLRNQYFNGTKRITMLMLLNTFRLCDHQEDKFKLGLVMLVECILTPTERYIDYKTLGMVENLEDFVQYPWGRKAYFVLLNSLRQPHLQRIQRMQENGQNECKYSLHGYPLAFQYWIYEAFPQIGRKFGRYRHAALEYPRMHKWRPKTVLSERTIQQFFATRTIEVLAILKPTEEELQTPWCTTLSLPQEHYHNILNGIVSGELDNVAPQDQENTDDMPTGPSTSRPSIETEAGPSSTYIDSNYVTKEELEHMLNIQQQNILSGVSGICDSLFATRISEQYQTLLHNQQQFFQQQQQWQEEHYRKQQQWQEEHYRGIQSGMQHYVDDSFKSVQSHINEQHNNILNELSDWKSNMEAAVGSLQQDVPVHASPIATHTSTSHQTEDVTRMSKERKTKGKKLQLPTNYPLEDYSTTGYQTIRDWVTQSPKDAFWEVGPKNYLGREFIKSTMDITQNISVPSLELELKLLRRVINNDSSLVSKDYAILDFNYEHECNNHMLLQAEIYKEGTIRTSGNLATLQKYVNGALPIDGRPWIQCKHLLIPCSMPGNNWYLYHVNIPEWKFEIYDCSNNIHTPELIIAQSNAVKDLTALLLNAPEFLAYRRYVRRTTNTSMDVDIIPYQPSVDKGPNCGIFVLKYIECFVLGYPIEIVSADRMTIYRRKIITDICLDQYFLN